MSQPHPNTDQTLISNKKFKPLNKTQNYFYYGSKSVNFKQAKGIKSAFLVILCCFILAVCILIMLGNPPNFMNNDPNNHPLPGNMLGTIYKGGVIVPVIQTLLLTVLVLSIERVRHRQGQG